MSRVSLFWRVIAVNAGVLVAAALALALSPATVSASPRAREAVVLAVGALAVVIANVVLLRRLFGPLERLVGLMRRVDPMAPGRRLQIEQPVAEVAELSRAFNEMLDRLESDRRSSGRRALAVQERERRRLARELHDELGQMLTGIVLQLEALVRAAPPELRESLVGVQDAARAGVEEVREIARGLRPQLLDEFGLRSALVTLTTAFSERSGVRVRHRLSAELPEFGPEEDLAIYRIAQEGLTNVARHAEARGALLSLETANGSVVLRVCDDGRGIDPAAPPSDGGIGGMRERAMLVGGVLGVRRVEPTGTEVVFTLPARRRS